MDDQDRKFVCKWCNKRFPCGKSLGGHIRSHMIVDSPEKNGGPHMKKVSSLIAESQFELNGSPSSYGLRENPRKTFKAVDAIASFPLPQEKVCKQCGKVFQSLKALCGHMAFHSEKDKGLKDDHSWTSENQDLVMDDDDHSDTESEEEQEEEEEDLFLWSKAKCKSYKKITIKSSSSLVNYGSSSASEIDEQDQEEVAMCLMMLSKDSSGNWGGVNSVVESSDNHSVILETKSSSIDTKFVRKDAPPMSTTFAPNETPQTKKVETEVFEQENSDSGYYLDEVEKIESDTSVDGFLRPNVSEGGVKNEETLAEIRRSHQVREKKNMERENGRSVLLSKLAKYEERKDNNNEVIMNESFRKVRHASVDAEQTKRVQKRSKYECMNCKKTFSTYQGLGGHRPCNKKVNYQNEGWYDNETGENSLEDEDTDPDDNNKRKKKAMAKEKDSTCKKVEKKMISLKKNKIHECPYCNRIFKNGQALGGHKRSHFLGSGGGPKETRIRAPPVLKTEEQPELLDLNLPAPFEDEVDEQFVSR